MTHPLLGEQVALRPFTSEHLEPLVAYLNHPGLDGRRYAPGAYPDLPVTLDAGTSILERWSKTENEIHLAVVMREHEILIGHAAAYWGWDPHCPDVELVIAPEFQGRGFGGEAFQLLLRWVFQTLPAHSLSAFAAGWNQEGRRFLEKHGFSPAGISRREGIWRGAYVDEHVFDMLRKEWEARNGA